jgi:hypothetical protein
MRLAVPNTCQILDSQSWHRASLMRRLASSSWPAMHLE